MGLFETFPWILRDQAKSCVHLPHFSIYFKAKRIIYLWVLIERVKENTFAQLYLYLHYDCSQSQYTDH